MTDKSKIPEIRFKGFSENISSIKLKDVIVLNTYGPRFNANDYDINGNVKTIRGTDISLNGNILYNQVPIAKLDVNFIKSHILEDGDLVMITTADCGLTGIFEKQKNNYICSAYAVKIALNKKLAFPNYFKYFFQTSLAKKEVNKYLRTATISNLPASDILKITLMLPSIQEQEKIASFLNLIYKLIEQKEKKQQKLKQFKKAMLEKMFPKDGVDTPEIRFKGFSGKWEEKEIDEVVNRYDNLRIPISATDRILGNTPYYGANGIQGYVKGYTHNGEFILVAEDGANDLKNYPVQYVNGEIWVNNHTHVLQGKKEIANNSFLKFAISKINIEPFLVGGGRAKLNANIMMKINMTIPMEIEEQTKIGNYFQKLDKLIDLQQKELEKLKNIKKASLDKMFV